MLHDSVFLGLGSNVGDRFVNLKATLLKICELPATQITQHSSVYESAPVGGVIQRKFLNLAVQVTTELDPATLLGNLQEIESDLGRVRDVRWGPRTVDIDILYWGDRTVVSDRLAIPHPENERRRFVLIPLAEIAPEFAAPPHSVRMHQLLERTQDKNSVELYLAKEAYTIVNNRG